MSRGTGEGGQGPQREGNGKCTGGKKIRWESGTPKVSGSKEMRKITQQCIMFGNQRSVKRYVVSSKKGQEP